MAERSLAEGLDLLVARTKHSYIPKFFEPWGRGWTEGRDLESSVMAAVAVERERCAQVCDAIAAHYYERAGFSPDSIRDLHLERSRVAQGCAEAIRKEPE